jgi:predicted  nucleic acid-binding Zn-ribbon protein
VQHLEAQIKEAAKMKAIIREDLDRARADNDATHEALVAMTNQAADLREARAAYLMEMDRLLADFVSLRQQIKGA